MKSYTAKLSKSVKVLSSLTAALGVLALMTPQARAEVVNNETLPFSASALNDCNGDVVAVDGTVHVVERVTINGKNVHAGLHLNINVSGVGLPSGAIYSNANEQVSLQMNLTIGGNQTVAVNFRLIGQRQTPNLVVHSLFHITADANGNVTSFIDSFSADCH